MFINESREINAYMNNNCLVNNNNTNTGDINNNADLEMILKGLCEVKTQFANESNSSNKKFVN